MTPPPTRRTPARRPLLWCTASTLMLALAGCAPDAPAPAASTTAAPTGSSAPASPSASASGSDATSSAPPATSSSTAAPTPTTSTSSTVEAEDDAPRAARSDARVPMRAFSADEEPPQFVLFSFDNGLQNARWESFRAAAKESGAHFTVFQSGINLLADANQTTYTAPGNRPGRVGTELGGTEEEVAARVENINAAHAEGNEIGTHAVGHLCSMTPHGGDAWTTAEWTQELGTWFHYLQDVRGVNGFGEDFPQLTVPAADVKGMRLPCLDGRWDQLVPAWKRLGIEYDTSQNSGVSGVAWPYLRDGIWEFEMPVVHSPMLSAAEGRPTMVMAMDYNFMVLGNRVHTPEDDTAWLGEVQLDTYRYMFASAYHGNRAPLVFGNHFSEWAGNAFNPAQEKAMREICVQEDVHCVTYQQMVAWLELQDPAVLAQWQARPRSAVGLDADALGW